MVATPTQRDTSKRQMLVGKGWVQGVALVMLFSFFVMGILTRLSIRRLAV